MAKKKTQSDSIENLEQTLSRTEQFIEDNYRPILVGLGIIVLLVVGFWLMRNRINSMEEEARAEMFVAEGYFEADSFNLALNGDGINLGFLDIIDMYGKTKTGNLAQYYAGISYLHTEDFESAIEYLNGFSSDDATLSMQAKGAIGDAYLELGETANAIEMYREAVNTGDNAFLCPIYLQRLATVYELQEDYVKALETFRRLYEEYPESQEGRNAEKHIARMETKIQ